MTLPVIERPQPGPSRPYHFPRFERHTLANGMTVVIAPVRKLPLATVIAVVDAGASTDDPAREGLAALTARALLEGTARLDGAELIERAERLGAGLDSNTGWDAATVRLTALTERLPEALALLGEVLRTPSFPEREIERLKAERLAELLQQRAEPRGLADEWFDRVLYEKGSRYAAPVGGAEESVTALTRADVSRFFEARYRPTAVTLVVAGDVVPDEFVRLAEATFGGWRGGAPAHAPVADRPARRERGAVVVAKADAPQSELRVGHLGLPRTHPDFFKVVVMNAILGGLFSSRINLNLREVHAYTYGAHSEFDWRRGAGPFVVSTAVKSDITDAAAREILLEIERMRAEPPSADELSLATSYLDGVFPIRYETTAAIAAALSSLVIYGFPADYFDTYRERIRGVTREDVHEAARAHLHPDALQLVVVGDPGVIRAPLDAVGFGAVEVFEGRG